MSPEEGGAWEEDRDFSELPVDAYRAEILATLRSERVFICIGETGSGKTTRIPQFCLMEEAACVRPGQLVGVTQPRRVGAISVASRVAAERGVPVGGEVGYSLRFDNRTSAATRIKFMTDGILVRECMTDSMLSRYDVIILDEAHERSVHTDVLFALVKMVSARRPELHVIITSATLDAGRFSAYFGNCLVLRVPGRVFPVDLYHSKTHQAMSIHGPTTSTYVDAAAETVINIHRSEASRQGHILVFLTGREEIDRACRCILSALGPEAASDRLGDLLQHRHDRDDDGNSKKRRPDRMLVVPLHSTLSMDQQRLAFAKVPHYVRKCVVATNIAETSITVPHVRYVVDCGFVKQKTYDPTRHLESLVVVPVSQTAAQQRAGRAGRTGPGECYRLYSSESYLQMLPETVPEIRRCGVGNTVLSLKMLGITDVLGFDFIDPPSLPQMEEALQQLHLLGALDDAGCVTAEGARMARLPLDPPLSRMVVEAEKSENDCVLEMVSIVAAMASEGVFRWPSRPFQPHPALYNDSKNHNRLHDRSGASKRPRQLQGREAQQHDGERSKRPRTETSTGYYGHNYDGDDEDAEVDAAMAHASFAHSLGDHYTFLNVMRAWDACREGGGGADSEADAKAWCNKKFLNFKALKLADNIREQLISSLGAQVASPVPRRLLLSGCLSEGGTEERQRKKESLRCEKAVARCLVSGLSANVARRCSGGGDLLIRVPLVSPLFPLAAPASAARPAEEEPIVVHLSPQSWLSADKAALADRLYRRSSTAQSEFVVYQDLVCRSSRVMIQNVSMVHGSVVGEVRARWRFVSSRALCGLTATDIDTHTIPATSPTPGPGKRLSDPQQQPADDASRRTGAVVGARDRYLARKQQQQDSIHRRPPTISHQG